MAVLLVLGLSAHSAEPPGKMNPKLAAIPPFPALVAAAATNHIPLEQFDSPSASGTNLLHPGDSATVLITFVQKAKRSQWLLYLETTSPDAKQKLPRKPEVFVVTSSFGPPEKFESLPVPARLRLLGPFAGAAAKPSRPVETDARFTLNQDFLGLGLEQSAALLARWSQTTNFDQPVTSKALLALKPTPAEERAVCATFPALFSYADIVQHTEGLDELFFKLVETPSLWSLIRRRGLDVDISFGNGEPPRLANPADWNLPASASVYYFPWLLRLNNRPAMKITLVVTSPRPPLLICGGVVTVLAEKVGDDGTYMTMTLVSAHKN